MELELVRTKSVPVEVTLGVVVTVAVELEELVLVEGEPVTLKVAAGLALETQAASKLATSRRRTIIFIVKSIPLAESRGSAETRFDSVVEFVLLFEMWTRLGTL